MFSQFFLMLATLSFSFIISLSTSSIIKNVSCEHSSKLKQLQERNNQFDPLSDAQESVRTIIREERKEPYAIEITYRLDDYKPLKRDLIVYYKEYRKPPREKHTYFTSTLQNGQNNRIISYVYKNGSLISCDKKIHT